MKDLTRLVHSLTDNEINIVKNRYSNSKANKNSLKIKLLILIKSDKDPDDRHLSQQIYNTNSNPALKQLKYRLYDDIITVLAFEGGKTSFKSKLFLVKNKVRKYVINSEILFARGFDDLAILLLKRALKNAIKYELTSDLLTIYDLLQRHEGQKKGLSTYKKYGLLKRHEFNVLESKSDAHAIFYEVMLHDMFQKNNKESYVESLSLALSKLEDHFNLTQSVEIRALSLRAGTYYGHLNEKYEVALSYAQEYLRLTYENKIVSSLSNQAGAHMQLGMIYLYLESFSQSINHANLAAKLFPKNSINQLRAAEIKFVSCLQTNDLEELVHIINEVKVHPTYRSSNMIGEIWRLREIVSKFLNGRYEDSLKMLRTYQNELISESGWAIGYKIVELITVLELELYDWFEPRFKAFRLIGKTRGSDARLAMIVRVLLKLEKYNYNYVKLLSDDNDLVVQLEDGLGSLKWDPFSYEVVPFHKWIRSKEKSRPN